MHGHVILLAATLVSFDSIKWSGYCFIFEQNLAMTSMPTLPRPAPIIKGPKKLYIKKAIFLVLKPTTLIESEI